MKLENKYLTKNLFDVDENGKQANIKVNHVENFMKATISKCMVYQLVKIKMLRFLQ